MKIAESVVDVPANQLRLHPKNARVGCLPAIYESIKQFGFIGHLVVQRETNYILGGNHAYCAGLQHGMISFPVLYVECTEREAIKVLLVDNKASDGATWNYAALGEVMQYLKEQDLTAGLGFSEKEIDELARSATGEFQESKPVTKRKAGTIIQFGDINLKVPAESFELFLDEIRVNVGFSDDKVIQEIRCRFGLTTA